MKRKINRVGQNTLTVSLPADWVKRNNIKQGDEIEATEKGKNIIFGYEIKPENKKITIELKSSHQIYISSILRNLYIHGFDKITINYNSANDYLTISKCIRDFTGFEITRESKEGCVIESISEIKYEQFKMFYNKMFQLIISMQELLGKALKGNISKEDKILMDDFNSSSIKYSSTCRRSLTKNKVLNDDSAITMFGNGTLLIMIARTHASCYEFIYKNKLKVSEDTKNFFKEVNGLYLELYNLHLKKNMGSMSISEYREKIISEKLPILLTRSSGKSSMVLYYLGVITRLIGTLGPKISVMNDFLENKIEEEF